ncbi:MAG: hypothetical protein NTX75_09840 [Proteobacteria bacterium]|nr:hypothetical protein [Pseudomonadota bacterium]
MVNTLLGGSQDSTDPMISILMGAENEELMKASPGLVQKILVQEQNANNESASTSTKDSAQFSTVDS